ncbi:MAG TPA: hypothetical protein VKU80_12410, partial [Planctomycetota bacterium]|nr:hypothetical protein [Planctomycetota bacterium]
MGTIAILLCLTLQDESFRVDGSPFLVLGDRVELVARNVPKGAVVVWRLADGPGASIETRPPLSPSGQLVRGPAELSVLSVGRSEAEFRFTVSAERKGLRLATAEFKLRAGSAIPVRVWCRNIQNEAGGTRRKDLVLDDCQRQALQWDVNRFLKPVGIEVALEAAADLHGPEWWFDREGRFQPIVMKDGKKANSPALNDLLRSGLPGGLNVYLVRDLYWEQVRDGFERAVTPWDLLGVGLREGLAVVDDAADAVSLAHELGHALGLDDLKEKGDRDRLMCWTRRDRTDVLFSY